MLRTLDGEARKQGTQPKSRFQLRQISVSIPGGPKKYFCLIKHKMHKRRGIFTNELLLIGLPMSQLKF